MLVSLVKITGLNTIYGGELGEITLDEFLGNLEKKYGNEYNVMYYKSPYSGSYFSIIYGGKKYYLNLNDIETKDYELGKYNNVTIRLKKLVDRQNAINKSEEELENGRKDKENIIKNIEKSGIISNEIEKDIYLEYIDNDKKSINKEIIKNFGRLSWLIGSRNFPITLTLSIICDSNFLRLLGIISFVYGLVACACSDGNSNNFFWYEKIMNTFNNIKSSFKRKKINKYKVKQLLDGYNTESKSIADIKFEETLEEPMKKDLHKFKNEITNEFNKLIDKLDYINSKDKVEILTNIDNLLVEYKERYKNIINNNDLFDLDKDNITKLRIDMLYKISLIDAEILEIREKDLKINEVENECRLIEDRIDNSYININEIEEEKNRRDSEYARVKSKNNNRNKKYIN